MRLHLTPPQLFAAVSLLLIVATLAATSQTQARFFREAVIGRESVIVRDMVAALALKELSADDMARYADPAAQARFAQSFSILKNLSGVVRIKVFEGTGTIVWSDAPTLVGKHVTTHEHDLEEAIHGETRAVVNPAHRASHADEGLPEQELIEFYVPFRIARAGREPAPGAVSLYRSAKELNFTIRRGLALLWLVSGLGGLLLFGALYWLFSSVYRRQRAAESKFAKLSSEHERIVQMEKLSAMGQMVGEIAHQFNNPLVGVINLAQRAERQTDNPQRVKELLGEIRQAGEHCSGFVRRMLEFTRMSHSEPQATDLAALAQETIAFFRQTVGEEPRIDFVAPEGEEACVIQADPVLLRHALFNLIHNAAQADPQGPVGVNLAPAQREGRDGFDLTVADRGPGLSAEAAKKLFTPFFSTRPGGTGLGLSVAQHIVVQHGGVIRAEDNPGGGARFVVWLPDNRDKDESENTAG